MLFYVTQIAIVAMFLYLCCDVYYVLFVDAELRMLAFLFYIAMTENVVLYNFVLGERRSE